MPEPVSPEERAAFRRSLRETPIGLPPLSIAAELPGSGLAPAPVEITGARVEITVTFACTCDGTCPQECWRCGACSPRDPAVVPERVLEEVSRRIEEATAVKDGSEEDGDG